MDGNENETQDATAEPVTAPQTGGDAPSTTAPPRDAGSQVQRSSTSSPFSRRTASRQVIRQAPRSRTSRRCRNGMGFLRKRRHRHWPPHAPTPRRPSQFWMPAARATSTSSPSLP